MDNLELIQEIKKGLLNWYDFRLGSTILYIGNKGDVYPQMCQEQGMDMVSVSEDVTIDPQWVQEHSGQFDYLLAIRTLETQEKPETYLKSWKILLKPDGILLLGMNNRFGLKYFCGDRDPYTERNFDGIEGYRRAYAKKEDKFTGRCYSREEMRGRKI